MTLVGSIGILLLFGMYECWLIRHILGKRRHEEEIYWRNENNRLEQP